MISWVDITKRTEGLGVLLIMIDSRQQ